MTTETAIDPVCGMTVKTATAKHTTEHAGATVYFCAASCKARFEADPAAFPGVPPAPRGRGRALPMAAPAPPAAAAPGATWTCPMHPEVVRDGPGDCPLCGMALEPRGVAPDAPSPELADMTRRLAVSAVLTAPLFAVGMAEMLPGAVRALGWLAVLRPWRAIGREPRPQHVHADRARRRRRLRVQRGRGARAGPAAPERGDARRACPLLRGGRGHRHAGAGGPGAGAARARRDRPRAAGPARARAAHRAAPGGRRGARRPGRGGPGGRPPARPAGREGADGRRGP